MFALRTQRLTACHQDMDSRIGAQQRLRHIRRRQRHMFAIIQHQQQVPGPDRGGDPLRNGRAIGNPETQRGPDGRRDEVRVRQRRQFDDPRPIRKFRPQTACHLDTQPRLADPAGSGQGDQPVRLDQPHDIRQFGLASDQGGHRLRDIGPAPGVIRRRRGLAHRLRYIRLSNESVPAAGVGADHLPILAQRLAQDRDLRMQLVFAHRLARPDAAQNRILGNQIAAGFDQHHQQIECAIGDLDGAAIDQDLAPVRQHFEATDLDLSRRLGILCHRRREWMRSLGQGLYIPALL